MDNKSKRIILIGNGCVGSTFAFSTVINSVGRELGIIDIDKKKTEGDIMDLSDALSFCEPKKIFMAEYADCKDADIVVITAGCAQVPGENRLELLTRNLIVFKQIVSNVMASGFNGIFVIATNPVDIMTYATWKFSGLPFDRIIGTGTSLDTARFRKEIGDFINIDPRNVHAYILGEHGDSEFPVWSQADIGGLNFTDWIQSHKEFKKEKLDEIFTFVKNEAYYIIDRKGATYYGIATALTRILKAILNDENSVIPVSAYLNGQYGHNDIFIGVPCVIGKNGIKHVLELKLSKDEQANFDSSVKKIKNAMKVPLENIDKREV